MNIKNKLYGDGIHDDYPAIQEMLDSGMSCVYLPVPAKYYSISKTLRIHSNQELKLDRYTRICLADNSNCAMAENAEPKEWNVRVAVGGGIWDMNHKNQKPNPFHFPDPETGMKLADWIRLTGYDNTKRLMPDTYTGICFRFNSIRGFHAQDLTIVNPVIFGMQVSFVEDFTIENLDFEFTEGSPRLWNMDGVHVEGGCKNGLIRNLKGACHDNTVALTSDDSIIGPIENIVVDGIYGEKSHSAVRLLAIENRLRNIHISNIYGSYYAYAVVISKYNDTTQRRPLFENITIDNVYASLCPGTVDVAGNTSALISIRHDVDINSLYIANLHREETHCPMPTIGIETGVKIKNLTVLHSGQSNTTGKEIPFIHNIGRIENLHYENVDPGNDVLLYEQEKE